MFEEELKTYGMSEKEAKVYVALLSLGMSTANQIAEKTDLIRTTTYDILKAMKEKGIVSSVVKNKIIYFEAADPSKLMQILDEKKRKIQYIMAGLKELKAEAKERPALELYEGKEGIKTVYQDILNEKKPLASISNTHYVFDVLPFFVPNFINQRIKAKIPIMLLNEKTEESVELMKKKDKKELRETRFIEQLKDIPITEYIYGDNVAILNTRKDEPTGIIIRNSDFAREQKIVFDLLWQKAEK